MISRAQHSVWTNMYLDDSVCAWIPAPHLVSHRPNCSGGSRPAPHRYYLFARQCAVNSVIKSRIDKKLSYHRQTAQRSVLLKMLLSHWRSLSHLKLHRCLGCACKFLLAFHRYCSMLFIARTMPSEDVSLSVCLSHVGILSKRLNISSKFFSPSGSQTILVFPYQR